MDQRQETHEVVAPPPPTNPTTVSPTSHGGNEEVELTVDEIIETHLGSLGLSQIVHVFLLAMVRVFDSQITLVTIFSDAQPAWRCKEGGGTSCSAGTAATALCTMKPGNWEWVSGRKSSTIAEWDLVCGRKFEAGVPASMFFLGCILGSAVHGRLADAYLGRKKTMLLTCFLTAASALLTSLSPNVYVYALLRFLGGFARAGIGICSLVLSTEAVSKRWRGQVGQFSFFFFSLGVLSLPFIAYPTRHSWRTLYRVLSIPPLLYCLVVVPFLHESPRWLAVMGRKGAAMEVLRRFASRNGMKLPHNITISCDNISTGSDATNENLWTTWWAAKRMLTVMITGFGIGFVYYGIQLNVENLSFNLYFAVAVNALIELPAVFLGTVLIAFVDRRVLLSSSTIMAAVSCLLCIPFASKSGRSWPQLAMEALGFMASAMAFNVLYVYGVELFPTNVRNFAVSMLRQACMVGAAIAPLMVVLGRLSPSLLFIVFGAAGTFSSTMPFWLPETRNAPLYETLKQQEKEEKMGLNLNIPDSNSNP